MIYYFIILSTMPNNKRFAKSKYISHLKEKEKESEIKKQSRFKTKEIEKCYQQKIGELQYQSNKVVAEINNLNNNLNCLEKLKQVTEGPHSEQYMKMMGQQFDSFEEYLQILEEQKKGQSTKIDIPEATHLLIQRLSNIYAHIKNSIELLVGQTKYIWSSLQIIEDINSNPSAIIGKMLKDLEELSSIPPYDRMYSILYSRLKDVKDYSTVSRIVMQEYTDELYETLNLALSSKEIIVLRKMKYLVQILIINHRQKLQGLPVIRSQNLYRHVSIPQQLLALYKVKSIIYFTHLTSTSKRPLSEFSEQTASKSTCHVQFIFKLSTYSDQKNGKFYSGLDISQFSKYKNEQEVLLFPYQFFQIEDIQLITKDKSAFNFPYYNIKLTEIKEKRLVELIQQKKQKKKIENTNKKDIKPLDLNKKIKQANSNIQVKEKELKQKLQERTQIIKSAFNQHKQVLSKKPSIVKMYQEKKIQISEQIQTIAKIQEIKKEVKKIKTIQKKRQFNNKVDLNINNVQFEEKPDSFLSEPPKPNPITIACHATRILQRFQPSKAEPVKIVEEPTMIKYEGKTIQILPNNTTKPSDGEINLYKCQSQEKGKMQSKFFSTDNMNPHILIVGTIVAEKLNLQEEFVEVKKEIKNDEAQKQVQQIKETVKELEKNKSFRFNKDHFKKESPKELQNDKVFCQSLALILKTINFYGIQLKVQTLDKNFLLKIQNCFVVNPNFSTKQQEYSQKVIKIQGKFGKAFYFTNPDLLPLFIDKIPQSIANYLSKQYDRLAEQSLKGQNDYNDQYLHMSKSEIATKTICIINKYTQWGGQQMKQFMIDSLQAVGFTLVDYSEIFTDIQNKHYDIIWHISTNVKTMSIQEQNYLVNAHKSGVGLFLWTDNDPYFQDANIILNRLQAGFQMVGNYIGQKNLNKDATLTNGKFMLNHPVSAGFVTIYEGVTICHPSTVPADYKIFAYNSNTVQEAAMVYKQRNEKLGAIWIDTGFTKLIPSCHTLTAEEVKRYMINVSLYICKKTLIV